MPNRNSIICLFCFNFLAVVFPLPVNGYPDTADHQSTLSAKTEEAALYESTGNYNTILRKLRSLADKNPNVSLVALGQNDQGVLIQGLRIGQRSLREAGTSHLVVGTHHGNEQSAADAAMTFVDELLRDQRNDGSKWQNKVFYVFPVLNISGYDNNRRSERHANGNLLDSNRDYPDACAPDKDSFQLRSTRLLARFLQEKSIVGAITIHGYIGTFTFPWGTFAEDSHSPDHARFVRASEYAVEVNGYRFGTHADVIYPTVGAFEDWAYFAMGVWTVLLELDYRANLRSDARAMLRYFERVPAARSPEHGHHARCKTTAFDLMPVMARP